MLRTFVGPLDIMWVWVYWPSRTFGDIKIIIIIEPYFHLPIVGYQQRLHLTGLSCCYYIAILIWHVGSLIQRKCLGIPYDLRCQKTLFNHCSHKEQVCMVSNFAPPYLSQ